MRDQPVNIGMGQAVGSQRFLDRLCQAGDGVTKVAASSSAMNTKP